MVKFFRDQSDVDRLVEEFEYLEIPVKTTCVCIRDYGQSECIDMGSSCRAGIYIITPDEFDFVSEMVFCEFEGY